MRLVEGVVREGNQDFPQRAHRIIREAIGIHSGPEGLELDVEFFLLLLTHGSPEQVGLSEGVPGELLGDLHDLLLIDDQAIGGPQNLLEGFC